MTIADVLSGVPVRGALPESLARLEVSGLEYDSRRVATGYLFFAFPGARVDGLATAFQVRVALNAPVSAH